MHSLASLELVFLVRLRAVAVTETVAVVVAVAEIEPVTVTVTVPGAVIEEIAAVHVPVIDSN